MIINNNIEENNHPDNSSEDNKIKINPYNTNNKLVSEDDIKNILSKQNIIIDINNLENYQLAFIHKSYCTNKSKNENENIEIAEKPENALSLLDKSNETLEYLGDSIINFIVADYLYERFPHQNEGFMTRLRTRLVNGSTLGEFSTIIGISEYLIISRHVEERCNGRNNLRILEDIFESFVGAIYLDNNTNKDSDLLVGQLLKLKKLTRSTKILSEIDIIIESVKKCFCFNNKGFQICKEFVINIIENNIDFTDLITKDNNYKDQLLRYFQHNFQETPKYIEISCEGPPHDRQFTMGVTNNNGLQVGLGKGKTKKKAEQLASKNALIYFNVFKKD